jgi:hypothetical protein
VARGPSVAWRSARCAVSGGPIAMGRHRVQLQEPLP